MPTSYEKLSALLKELFQLDQSDLDFGIYRIMNQKRDEFSRFLDAELLPQVKTAFEQYHPADKKVLDEKIEQARKSAIDAGFDPEQSPRVKELRDQQANYSVDTEDLENEVYSHLYSFFRRYYDNGDFISMRRYKEGVYAIPYEGEEVKLHWANADQYYVKTTENFRDYSFHLPSGRLAHFKIVEAETEKDNVKADAEKERRFILAPEAPIAVEGDALILRFEYRADPEKRDQKMLSTLAAETILAGAPAEWAADLKVLAPTESNPKRSLLEKHLTDYTARNTFDYFIHKDLRGFLNRELDFYIKNEVMHLDDIEDESAPQVEQYLSKIKVLRQIAHKIIEFLAQIEDFQKKLWLKKKFVVETNYCITIDRVPETLYPEICANTAQREEWVRLFAIAEITGNQPAQPELGTTPKPGYSVPLTIEFLKANPFLVLDTKFFTLTFVDSLLATIENIDEQIDGFLIHSENFQALGFLQDKYRGQVKSIYIDPPYNAKSSEILYKNTYRNSSWLTLMFDRISLGKNLLNDSFVQIIAIDEVEQELLGQIISQIFPENRKVCLSIVHNPRGQQGKNISFTHEFAYLIYPNDVKKYIADVKRTEIDSRTLRDSGTESDRTDAATCFYPIFIKDDRIIGFGEVPNDDYHPAGSNVTREDGIIEVWPIDDNGNEKKWRYSNNSINKIMEKLQVKDGRNSKQIIFNQDMGTVRSLWVDAKYDASEYGTKVIQDILGVDLAALFSYPKSINTVSECLFAAVSDDASSLVVDYFAGSGTTGHAVINLNRDDGGHRKYILVEMGEYFNTVLKPRIEKVIYSKDWKDGKPVSRVGSSHCFKYLRLESYEDALNNLSLQRTHEQQLALEANPEFKENYVLSYMLDVESKGSLLNTQSFVHPFDYQLNIAAGTVCESKATRVDLVETFNYLIGLHVETIQSIRGFRVVTGKNPAGERTLIIWRDLEAKSNADLEAFFRKQDYNPRDMEYDLIYVNGDNNLENIRRPDETWKVRLIEEEFVRLMFDTESN